MVRINHNKPIEKCESYVRANLKILLKEENQGSGLVESKYAHDVVLTSVRRRFNVMDAVWTSKQRRVLTGIHCTACRGFFLMMNEEGEFYKLNL